MKIEDGKLVPECLNDRDIIRNLNFVRKLVMWNEEVEKMTNDKSERIQLKLSLLKSLKTDNK